ncbi:MAG: 3',5'-cyclic-AMP phosphodiesterase [Mariprofundus sp.]|nr:3',5'-cyclic-AMP phosphodiesterase [Mariprofundus sp.]
MVHHILHLTDTHLFDDAKQQLKGICTHDSFAAVIQNALQHYPKPDAIILGGDMAQDETAGAYQQVADMLQGWSAPWLLSPGNHANTTVLDNILIPALQAISSYTRCLQLETWQIISLNSHEQGSVGGILEPAELQRLDTLLSNQPNKHTLIAVHHHPVRIHSRWLDRIGLLNSAALWEVIEHHNNVRALLCGHIHQAFDVMHQAVRVLGSPSTCIQFKPQQTQFTLDNQSPGYRYLSLLPDGQIQTTVERISGFIPADLSNDTAYY